MESFEIQTKGQIRQVNQRYIRKRQVDKTNTRIDKRKDEISQLLSEIKELKKRVKKLEGK